MTYAIGTYLYLNKDIRSQYDFLYKGNYLVKDSGENKAYILVNSNCKCYTVTHDEVNSYFKKIEKNEFYKEDKKLKFEPTHLNNQYYKTRDGHKVKIYEVHDKNEQYPIHGARFKDNSWQILNWEASGIYMSENNSCVNTDIIDYWEESKSQLQEKLNKIYNNKSDDLSNHIIDSMRYGISYSKIDMKNQENPISFHLEEIDKYLSNQVSLTSIETKIKCNHKWQTIFLLSSTKENCELCGIRREDV